MSLSKQLVVMIAVRFLVVFRLDLLLSINKSRGCLENEAQGHAQDIATSLG
jgi:hypothetical protein